MVNMGEIFSFDFIGSQQMERVDLSPSELSRLNLSDGDLLFGRRSVVEAGAGKCALVVEPPEPLTFESSIIRVRLRPDAADSRFFFYYFASPAGRGAIRTIVTGAAVKGIRGAELAKLYVEFPPLELQRGIAAVLWTYDELIANNRLRMALLEEAARQVFRQWFVRFRFPGYEHARVIDGAPRGWQQRRLGECATFVSGGTPTKSREDFWNGDLPWVSSGELADMRISDTTLHITAEAAETGSRLVPRETILAVVRGMSLAKEWRIAVTSREVAFNQDIKAIVPHRDVDALFLFHSLDVQRDQVRDRAGEAAHGTKKIETAVLSSLPVIVPSALLQRLFREHIAPLHDQWDNLHRQNVKLRAARDLLLPRLMSGEIAV